MRSSSGINPWTFFWGSPGLTVRRLNKTGSLSGLLLLTAFLGFIASYLFLCSSTTLPPKVRELNLIATAIVISIPVGFILLGTLSLILQLIGRFFKEPRALLDFYRAAAWAHLPHVLTLLGWVFIYYVFGYKAFDKFSLPLLLSTTLLSLSYLVITVSEVLQVRYEHGALHLVLSFLAAAPIYVFILFMIKLFMHRL